LTSRACSRCCSRTFGAVPQRSFAPCQRGCERTACNGSMHAGVPCRCHAHALGCGCACRVLAVRLRQWPWWFCWWAALIEIHAAAPACCPL
jgi:hypothetical protein